MENKRYHNPTTGKWHTAGRGITHRIDEHTVFSGVPSEEQLKEWGYEEYVPPVVEEPQDYVDNAE